MRVSSTLSDVLGQMRTRVALRELMRVDKREFV